MKWRMHDSKHFTGEKDGYIIDLNITSGKTYPVWQIIKDGQIVDAAYYHSPVTTDFNRELAAKVQAEKYLDKLLNYTEEINKL